MTPERWRKVRDVLEQALDLDPEKRERFLDIVCSSDHSLRTEVQSLLSAEGDASSSFLESSPLGSSRLTAGTRLGDYEIVAQLGAGGMGVVYRARDLRLERSVAIKVLQEPLLGDTNRLHAAHRVQFSRWSGPFERDRQSTRWRNNNILLQRRALQCLNPFPECHHHEGDYLEFEPGKYGCFRRYWSSGEERHVVGPGGCRHD